MEEVARRSREKCQLRAHAGTGNEHFPEALGVGGGQSDRPANRIVQIQYSLYGKLGREDGIRPGQALSGIKDSHLDKSPRTPDGRSAGRNAGCSGVRELRKQRDGGQVFSVHSSRRRGSSSAVVTRCQRRTLES